MKKVNIAKVLYCLNKEINSIFVTIPNKKGVDLRKVAEEKVANHFKDADWVNCISTGTWLLVD